MNRFNLEDSEIKDAVAIFEKYLQGAEIEFRGVGWGKWAKIDKVSWDFDQWEYRIAPKTVKAKVVAVGSGRLL
jgi:hypothetical protein